MPWSSTQWTPERTERLTKLWERGFSAGLIAVELRTSRNSVIGKINRLKLEWRPETQLSLGNRGKRARPSKSAPRPAHLLTTEQQVSNRQPPAAPHRWVSLLELRPRQCRWPHGDGPYKFCGATVLDEFSYCPAHARAAYPGLSKQGK